MMGLCPCSECRTYRRRFLRSFLIGLGCLLAVMWLFSLAGCASMRPQRGGGTSTTLGGAQPTVVTNTAPENPQTPSTTTVEKTITRDYAPTPPTSQEAAKSAETQISLATPPAPRPPVSLPIVRETVTERATTQLGSAQKDTARELGARLGNMRGVMWVGVALLIIGPIVGWRMGWLTNGLIAGAAGLVLIILAQVVPGNEAWFGLGGLLLIPLVGYVYYRAHHDARNGVTGAP